MIFNWEPAGRSIPSLTSMRPLVVIGADPPLAEKLALGGGNVRAIRISFWF